MADKPSKTKTQKSGYQKYTDEEFIKKYYMYYIGLIWVITFIILLIIWWAKKDSMDYMGMPNMGMQPMGMQPMGMQPMGMDMFNNMGNMAQMLPGKYGKMARTFIGGSYNKRHNIQSGGLVWMLFGSGVMDNIAYIIPILLASILTIYILWKYAKKSKCIAYVLAIFMPIIPANRIYTGNLTVWTLIRMIPIVGQIFDVVQLYLNKLVPPSGWSGDGTCKLI